MPIIDTIFNQFNRSYGSPRIHQELLEMGYVINRKQWRMSRICFV